MCQDCLLECRPDRGSLCLDDGAYLLNFKGCVVCGKRSRPNNDDRCEQEEEGGNEECTETTFTHVCSGCGHQVASHYYRETLNVGYVCYLMECSLCGKGSQEKERYRYHHHIIMITSP
jgi:hypothetical protein